ncbi:MAG: response regulator [Lachnospiraceae bacterium]|nr:response regulator [Lachnospiraceae bacterium]
MNIGKRIQALRKEKNMTQEVLAAEMGVTVGAVSKWENDISIPDILMLCALADFFSVSTDHLLGRVGKTEFMVCDDASLIGRAIKDILEKEGNLCTGIFENGTELLQKMRVSTPYAVFLDVHLPNEDGIEVLQRIKEAYPHVKVIMVTADNSADIRHMAMEHGADAFVTKPFQPEQITVTLNSIIYQNAD